MWSCEKLSTSLWNPKYVGKEQLGAGVTTSIKQKQRFGQFLCNSTLISTSSTNPQHNGSRIKESWPWKGTCISHKPTLCHKKSSVMFCRPQKTSANIGPLCIFIMDPNTMSEMYGTQQHAHQRSEVAEDDPLQNQKWSLVAEKDLMSVFKTRFHHVAVALVKVYGFMNGEKNHQILIHRTNHLESI